MQNANSYLSWLDISIGKKVGGYPTGLGRLDVMCQNPSNAIIHLGHSGGKFLLFLDLFYLLVEALYLILCFKFIKCPIKYSNLVWNIFEFILPHHIHRDYWYVLTVAVLRRRHCDAVVTERPRASRKDALPRRQHKSHSSR